MENIFQPIVKLEPLDTFHDSASQRAKIGEIYHVSKDRLMFVCSHCTQEFPLFNQFTAHIQSHLAEIFDDIIDSGVSADPWQENVEQISCDVDLDVNHLDADERLSECDYKSEPRDDSIDVAATSYPPNEDSIIPEQTHSAAKSAQNVTTRTYECFQCHLPLLTQASCLAHMRLHRQFPFVCEYCKKGFTQGKYKIHEKLCGPRNRVQCPHCPIKLHNAHAMYRHRHEVHPTERPLFTEHLPDQQKTFERFYTCNSCPFRTAVILEMLAHAKTCNGRMKLCPICKKLVVKNLLKTHLEWHTYANNADEIEVAEKQRLLKADEDVKIKQMNDPCNDDSDWSGHWSDDNNEKQLPDEKDIPIVSHVTEKYKCLDCGKYLQTKQALIGHRKTHDKNQLQPRTFECFICHSTMSTRTKCVAHMRLHAELPFQCEYCQLKFTAVHFKSHRKRCGPSNEFQCIKCPLKFHNAFALTRHRMVAHDKGRKFTEHIPDPNRPSEKYYTCNLCPYKSNKRRSMASHVQLYCAASRSPCKTCGKLYSSAVMGEHILTHSTVKSHLCLLCGKLFKTSRLLEKHMPLHSDVRKFQCDLCPKSYKRSNHLLVHKQKSHTAQFTQICPICSMGFHTSHLLKRHIRMTHSAWCEN